MPPPRDGDSSGENSGTGVEGDMLLYEVLQREPDFTGTITYTREYRSGSVAITTTYSAIVRSSRITGLSVKSRGHVASQRVDFTLSNECYKNDLIVMLLLTPVSQLEIERHSSPYAAAAEDMVSVSSEEWVQAMEVAKRVAERLGEGRAAADERAVVWAA